MKGVGVDEKTNDEFLFQIKDLLNGIKLDYCTLNAARNIPLSTVLLKKGVGQQGSISKCNGLLCHTVRILYKGHNSVLFRFDTYL